MLSKKLKNVERIDGEITDSAIPDKAVAGVGKMRRVCNIGILITMLAILSFPITAQGLSSSGGGNWQYYRSISISNNGGSLTDYQVLVNLTGSDFPALSKSDGSDLRFVDESGAELSYWIESWDYTNKKARIWVKVTNIPANSNTILTMYYGNPAALSVSNGNNTFVFFDDFEDGTYTGWSLRAGNAILGVSNGWFTAQGTSSLGNVEITADNSIVSNHAYELKIQTDFGNNPNRQGRIMFRSTRPYYNYVVAFYPTNIRLLRQTGSYSETELDGATFYWDDTKVYNMKITGYGNQLNVYINDVLILSASDSTYSSGNIEVGLREVYGGTWKFDDTRVRNYAYPEPTVSVGAETVKALTFVQLTDVHIGPDILSCSWLNNSDSENCLSSLQTSIDRFKIVRDDIIAHKPNFVLVTGDLVEWNSASQYAAFNTLVSKFKENNITVYIVPGNHDRRGKEHPLVPFDTACPERLLYNCFNNLDNYRHYIGSNDSSGIYKYEDGDYFEANNGYRFIGLDSGYDASFNLDPVGSGLSTGQINFANNSILEDKTIIFMHHPAIDDTCPYDSCNVISKNRTLFVGLAKEKHVKLVLTGHTHRSKFFDSNGRVNVNNFRVNVTIPITNINTFIRTIEPPYPARSPLFIQTRSATKDEDGLRGYLIVNMEGTSVSKERISLDDVRINGSNVTPVTILYLNSPADLHIYDESGRYTGLNATGEIENSIPDSYYFEEYKMGNTTLPAFALLYNTTLNYSYEIVSNFSRDNITSDQAVFNFTIKQKIQGAITTIKYNNVSINRNSKAYLQINTTQTNYTMQIDLDNDSIIDTIKQPDTIETDYAPTATIISPANGSTWDQGQPITFNGSGIDSEDGTLNKLTWVSDRDDVIGQGNFTTANLSAGVHNIILLVNDSAGQVNTANIVITVRDTVPPVLNIDYPPENKIFNRQNISVSGIAYDDSGILNVTVNGLQAGQENWDTIVTLNEGLNVINVTATDNNGFSTTANRTVYYNSSLASDTEPPAAITNLTHKTGYDGVNRAWINWTWDNPKDADFSYAMIYVDDIFMGNTSMPYFNITGLSTESDYNITILSADIVDNINLTGVRDTARTVPPDTIPAVTVADLTGSIGNNGWYISDVQINLTATDNEGGSGVSKTEYSFDGTNWSIYTVPLTITDEGTTTVYYSSTDNAGNVESVENLTISADKTPPQVTLNTPANEGIYILNQTLIASWSVYDPLSGIASATGTVPNGLTIDTGIVGAKTFNVTAIDNASNTAAQNAFYTITYNYLGILPPIRADNSSIFKLGRIVPVKFRIVDANGNNVSTAVANLTYQKITDDILGTIEEPYSTSAADSGNTFRYDGTDNLYIFNLDTSSMDKGTYRLNINLNDGTVHTVHISIRP